MLVINCQVALVSSRTVLKNYELLSLEILRDFIIIKIFFSLNKQDFKLTFKSIRIRCIFLFTNYTFLSFLNA